MIRAMQAGDATAIARLHAATITQGFLTRLGPRFLRQVYLGVAADPTSRVWVAAGGSEVLGFLAYAVDVGAMYRRILRSRMLRLGWASLPYTLNPWVVREVLDTLRYPHKQTDAQLPPAEILSVGVSPAARGGGVGRRLIEAAVEQARRDGQAQLKVLAGARLHEANRFYPACGFRLLTQLMQHGEPLNVYVMDLRPPDTSAGI